MKAAGAPTYLPHGRLIAFGIAMAAGALALVAYLDGSARPSTDDASIDAEIVHVAPAVGGRIVAIGVRENMRVRKGALLLQIDPLPYRLAVAQAQADLAVAEAQLATQRRIVSTQRSNATVAADQSTNANATSALAARTAGRLRPLAAAGYVPRLQLDQAEVAARNAAVAAHQSKALTQAAYTAIDTENSALALVAARKAALALAQRGLADTTVHAEHDGLVVGLTVASGEFVVPGQALFTLIDAEEWYAVGNFRETDLDAISPGDCATVYAMADRSEPIRGVVDGIGWGVFDAERVNIPRSVPYVERSLNWVRVAQRFPVRVRLEHPPARAMRLGASAVVEVKHGRQCN
ncbi:MAG TPA: multidrug transporter subunit MdtN [Rhizomicrobium sp.]